MKEQYLFEFSIAEAKALARAMGAISQSATTASIGGAAYRANTEVAFDEIQCALATQCHRPSTGARMPFVIELTKDEANALAGAAEALGPGDIEAVAMEEGEGVHLQSAWAEVLWILALRGCTDNTPMQIPPWRAICWEIDPWT